MEKLFLNEYSNKTVDHIFGIVRLHSNGDWIKNKPVVSTIITFSTNYVLLKVRLSNNIITAKHESIYRVFGWFLFRASFFFHSLARSLTLYIYIFSNFLIDVNCTYKVKRTEKLISSQSWSNCSNSTEPNWIAYRTDFNWTECIHFIWQITHIEQQIPFRLSKPNLLLQNRLEYDWLTS